MVPLTTLPAWRGDPGQPCQLRSLDLDELPGSGVTVRVLRSSLNYKDALALSGRGRILRRPGLAPGIDLGGLVVASDDARWQVGDSVFATGHGLGEDRHGGFAGLNRLAADELLAPPAGRDLDWCLSVGTAGLTAALCLAALERHGVTPEDGPLVVSGASGGVGSLAIRLAVAAGWRVLAVSGRSEHTAALRQLGAAEVLGREALLSDANKALGNTCWAAAIDCVGGAPLAGILKRLQPGGAAVTVGMAAGPELPTTVFPFILRGVALLGVSAGNADQHQRHEAWGRLSALDDPLLPSGWLRTVPLAEAGNAAAELLDGRAGPGRTVIAVGSEG